MFGIETNTKRRRLGQSKVPVWGVTNQCQTNLFMKILIPDLESLANGVTLGGYDWLDNEYGLGAKERRQNLQQAADNAGVGQAFALANQATKLVGDGIGLYGIANIPSAARNAYNVYNIYKGTRNLENQLQRGHNFEDIYMGRIDRNKLDEINKIRQELGEPTIPSEKVKLLKNDIQHIWNRRIHEGGSLPKDVGCCSFC